ncbi:MAG: class I SAM-dependent methyltransferase [Candidatus Marinimicrobia bacterium]|nr:class I SAM-dependent methyltransferase [Candidatus Neomarinimicrobiota bacterium]
MTCPLCSGVGISHYHENQQRVFLKCPVCSLVFVHPDHFLSPDEEFKRYELHNNHPDDPDYRAFLAKLVTPISQLVRPQSIGLDFGSGPTPLVQSMFQELGHQVSIFDIFYAPDQSVFDRQYDFITASEVLEHLHHPMVDLNKLWSCLRPGGYLGIMTALIIGEVTFASWYYALDPTHVVFYAPETMEWLANYWGVSHHIIGNSIILFQKS